MREEGGWAIRTCQLATEVPFDVRLPCPPEMVTLVGRMDGTRTVRELYDEAATQDALGEDASVERLASFVHLLTVHGLVELRDRAGA